jgi:hypothetical protein
MTTDAVTQAESVVRCLLKEAGFPLVMFQPDGHVLVCKAGTWADGANLTAALASLKTKLDARTAGGLRLVSP